MFDTYWNSFRKSRISFSAVVIGPQMFSKFLFSLNMQDHRRSGDCSGVNRTHQCCVTTSGSRFAYSMDDFDFSESWKSKLARHVVLWFQHVQSFLKSLCECGDCSGLFKIMESTRGGGETRLKLLWRSANKELPSDHMKARQFLKV